MGSSNDVRKNSSNKLSTSTFKTLVFLLLMLAVSVGGGFYWVDSVRNREAFNQASSSDTESPAPAVSTVRAIEEPVEVVLPSSGELQAYEDARLSFKVPGYVSELYFQPGDSVVAGQVLAKLDATDFNLAVRRAEAELQQACALLGVTPGNTDNVNPHGISAVVRTRAEREEAERRVGRIRELRARDSASQSELDAAETACLVARHTHQEAVEIALEQVAILRVREAEVEQARLNLAYATLTAPFDGYIQEKLTGPGAFLEEADPVYRLVRIDTLRLRVEIPERDVHSVFTGQSLRFRIAGEDDVHHASLTRLLPQLDAETRVLFGEADVKNPGTWRPGLFVRAELVVSDSNLFVTVPTFAITSFVGIYRVFVVQDGIATAREIVPGRAIGERTVVLEGLAQGEEVILEPGDLLSGAPVRVVSDG